MAKNSEAQAALDRLNAEYAVLKLKGKVRIVSWEQGEDRSTETPVFSAQAEMKTLFANQFVQLEVPTGDDGTKTVRKPLFNFWLEHPDRPTAIGVTMDPKGGRFVDGKLNLWRGYGAEPDFADWSLLHHHIVDVVCAGNQDHAEYLLRWIAWTLQHPTEPSEVVIVLRGRKGTGKGVLGRVLAELFGSHGMQISDRKHLVGSFNAHLLQVCLLFSDEAFWPGDKSAEGPLKRMITEPTLFVEPKGLDAFEVKNRLSIVMASNEGWVVPASEDERRYAVFDVADTHRQDFAYFDALNDQLERGGLSGFLGDMLYMDLGSWHPRQDVPVTKGLRDQQAESVSPLVNWLGELLEEGVLPFSVRDATGQVRRVVHKSDPALARPTLLLEVARVRDKRLQHLSDVALWTFLDEHEITKADDKRDSAGRYRRFPPLEQARQAFRERYPFWPEFSEPGAVWRFGGDEGFEVLPRP